MTDTVSGYRPLAAVAARRPEWYRVSLLSRRWELRAGPDLAGRIQFGGFFNERARAECADGAWTFQRVGFVQREVVVRRDPGETPVGRFRYRIWHRQGSLTLADGRAFTLSRDFWGRSYELTSASSLPLVTLRLHGFFRVRARLEIRPEALREPALPMMVLLAWYLVILFRRDGARRAAMS